MGKQKNAEEVVHGGMPEALAAPEEAPKAVATTESAMAEHRAKLNAAAGIAPKPYERTETHG